MTAAPSVSSESPPLRTELPERPLSEALKKGATVAASIALVVLAVIVAAVLLPWALALGAGVIGAALLVGLSCCCCCCCAPRDREITIRYPVAPPPQFFERMHSAASKEAADKQREWSKVN